MSESDPHRADTRETTTVIFNSHLTNIMAYDSIIPDAFPNLYADQWRLGVQQLTSRLESYVNTEVIHGEGKRYQKLPSVAARQITTRFGDTNPDDIDVEYRWLYVNFKDSAHILDRREALQLGAIGSPHSQIMRLQLATAGRDRDKTLIDGIRGSVATGKNGAGTPITLPAGQKIANTVHAVSAAANNFNIGKFIEACRILGTGNVAGQDVESGSSLTLIITHNQVASMLKQTAFTSADFGLQRLMSGEVVNFMGVAIKVVDPALLPKVGNNRYCYMFARNSVVFGLAENPTAWTDVLPGKRHDVQLRTEWGWGATRLDEEGVVEILCDETAA